MHRGPYRSGLGSLLHVGTRTRPDLWTAVLTLGKFQSAPAPRYCKAMKDVPLYLKGTMDYGIRYRNNSTTKLEAWSDADWARDQDKRRSRSGIAIFTGVNPVLWSSKLQPCVATSTAETEFHALSKCTKAVHWCCQVL